MLKYILQPFKIQNVEYTLLLYYLLRIAQTFHCVKRRIHFMTIYCALRRMFFNILLRSAQNIFYDNLLRIAQN